MKKPDNQSFILQSILMLLLMGFTSAVSGQEVKKAPAALPDDINKIVTFSCMPCHSSTGGMLSKSKLNFTKWAEYSAEEQKEKANEIYKEVSKKKMPPKDARETRPDIIPTKEQVEIIKKWAGSL